MKKMKGMAFRALAVYTISVPLLLTVGLELFLLLLLPPQNRLPICPIVAGVGCLVFLLMFLFHRGAFCTVEIDENGIRNPHVSLSWQEISHFSSLTVSVGLYPKFTLDRVFYTGQPVESFSELDPRCSVFFVCDSKMALQMEILAGKSFPELRENA